MFNRNFFLGSGCYAVQTIWLVCLRPGIHHLYIKHLRNKWCSHASGSTCILTRILETVPVYLNIMTKPPWVRGEFVWLNPFNRSQSVREARIKLKVGTEAETKEEILPTTCSHDLHSQPSLHNSGAPAWRSLPTVGWTLPNQPLIEKTFHRHAHRSAWWRQSLSWGSLSPGDSSLLQTDKELNSLGTAGVLFLCPDSWVWQTALKPSLSVLRARLHSSNVFLACAMAGLIKSPSQSCLWILRYICVALGPLAFGPVGCTPWKHQPFFFLKGSHFLVCLFFFLPTLQCEALDICGGRSAIQLQTVLWTEHSIRSRRQYERSYPGSV